MYKICIVVLCTLLLTVLVDRKCLANTVTLSASTRIPSIVSSTLQSLRVLDKKTLMRSMQLPRPFIHLFRRSLTLSIKNCSPMIPPNLFSCSAMQVSVESWQLTWTLWQWRMNRSCFARIFWETYVFISYILFLYYNICFISVSSCLFCWYD
jgi:hypothetical protein